MVSYLPVARHREGTLKFGSEARVQIKGIQQRIFNGSKIEDEGIRAVGSTLRVWIQSPSILGRRSQRLADYQEKTG